MNLPAERVPFSEAIEEKLLLRKAWKELSKFQQTVLLAFYGLPLPKGYEDYWAISQGNAEYDDFGFPTQVTPTPYEPHGEYNQMWAMLGRRSGKSSHLGALIFAYECLLGGHTAYAKPGQPVLAFWTSYTKDAATQNLGLLKTAIEDSPVLKTAISRALGESIELVNGITIRGLGPSIKGPRGFGAPVVGLDENAFYYKDADSANPDVEVERAVAAAQIQFPHFKRFGISTPWTKEGLLWQYFNAGTEGVRLPPDADKRPYKGILFVEAPTAAVGNPLITRVSLEREQLRDPEGFEREFMVRFSDAQSAFFSGELLKQSTERNIGIAERVAMPREGHPEDPVPHYVAAIDPAFRYDAFAFTVLHHELDRGIVVDAVRRFLPAPGQRLNPEHVLEELQPLLVHYRIQHVYSDQYQLESLQQLALKRNLTIEGVDFLARSKGKIYGNLQQLLNRQQLQLLDPQTGPAQHAQFTELLTLERTLSKNGAVLIAAPKGKHDDMAAVLALAAHQAVWLLPGQQADPNRELKLKSHVEKGLASIMRTGKGSDSGLEAFD